MEIHQLLVTAAPGDAVTAEALLLQRQLARVGPSQVFAQNVHPALPDVQPLQRYADLRSARASTNLLIVHGSIGDARFFDFLRHRREDLVLRYHNVTPPEMVKEYDPRLARLLSNGLRDLGALAPRTRLALACSAFSASELSTMGFADIGVAPVVFDVEALRQLPPPDDAPAALRGPAGGPVVVFVGRIVPNKNQPALVAAFHVLKTYLRPDARLMLVGNATPGAYLEALHRTIAGLALIDVTMTGAVSPAVLAATYRAAGVFVCLSRHEGFGVPLVEAMGFGVPVVAWDTSAVGEVVGRGGILLDTPSPTLVAEAMAAMLEDGADRTRVVEGGHERARDFTTARTTASFLGEIARVM